MTHRFETIQSLISAIRFESYEYIVPLCNSFHIDFEDPPTLNVCPFKKNGMPLSLLAPNTSASFLVQLSHEVSSLAR